MVERLLNYPNNIKKEEKAGTDYIWQAQTKESVVILQLAKIQDEALILMLQARNLMHPNVCYLKEYIF